MTEANATGVSVKVDGYTCESTGFCVRTLPAVFSFNDDGIAVVDEAAVPDFSLDELTEVESMCPTTAIRVDQA